MSPHVLRGAGSVGLTGRTSDEANRLTSQDGVTYSWDNNGNLLSDGLSTYTYDHANRLKGVVQGGTTFTFAHSGLSDRVRLTVNSVPTNYTLDLAGGLTQVLSDGTNAYLYGTGRIGEEQPGGGSSLRSECFASSIIMVTRWAACGGGSMAAAL